MTETSWPTWHTVPEPVRALGRWVTVVQVVGYTTALIYVRLTTGLRPAGIAGHYRGTDAVEGAMEFPKSLAEMLTITHTHLLAMAAIFLVSGLCLTLCDRVPDRWKRGLVVEPFIALLVSFGAMWGMRYLDPRLAWLLAASSALMAVTFYLQAALILRETWVAQ